MMDQPENRLSATLQKMMLNCIVLQNIALNFIKISLNWEILHCIKNLFNAIAGKQTVSNTAKDDAALYCIALNFIALGN